MKNHIAPILLIFLLTFFYLVGKAQNSLDQTSDGNNLTDSLEDILISARQDTTKIKILEKLCAEYTYINYAKAKMYGEQGLQLAQKINDNVGIANCSLELAFLDDLSGNYSTAIDNYNKSLEIFERLGKKEKEARCYSNLGCIYFTQANHTKAIECLQKAMNLYAEVSNTKAMAYCYINIGNVHNDKGSYAEAIELFQKALKISEELGDKTGMAAGYANIGGVHFYQQTYDKALEYYSKGLELSREIGDKRAIAFCLNNIGSVYENQKNYEKALEYYYESLEIRKETGDKQGMATCYNNIGSIKKEQYYSGEAMEYFNKALELYQFLGDTGWVALVYGNIANLNNKSGKFDIAKDYAEKCLKLAKQIGELQSVSMAYENLWVSYKGLRNYQKALENYEMFKLINDSLYNSEKHEQLAKMEAIYQSEKKQKEIELQESQLIQKEFEIKQQKTQNFALILGVAVMFLSLLFIYNSYRNKRKANIRLSQLNSEITKQKQEIEEKSEALNQQNEEIRAQKDEIEAQRDLVTSQKQHIEVIHQEVTDSIRYAERIQKAVLPGTGYIQEKFNGEFFILFKPKNIVSGDFYFVERNSGMLLIAVTDCTGHGVPGAFMSMLGISFLNEIIGKKGFLKPSQILDQLRNSVIDALKQKGESGEQKDGMDIALCVINLTTLEMQFAGANNPIYIVKEIENDLTSSNFSMDEPVVNKAIPSAKELIEIKGDKQPIGIHERMVPFTNKVFQLHSSDLIYLMSDGYEDQFGGHLQKKFLSKNLKRQIFDNCQLSMGEQKIILETKLLDWMGNIEQIDDITVIGLKIPVPLVDK